MSLHCATAALVSAALFVHTGMGRGRIRPYPYGHKGGRVDALVVALPLALPPFWFVLGYVAQQAVLHKSEALL